ncbi:MAG: helix-turn-helix transcriptional regulator [Armatimonadota bacterium]
MALLPILCYPDPRLHSVAKPVQAVDARIRELSDEMFKYGEAQLYPALRKLEEAGYVVGEWVMQEGKPNRRVYSITDEGGKFLLERQKEFEKFVKKVNAVMKLSQTFSPTSRAVCHV